MRRKYYVVNIGFLLLLIAFSLVFFLNEKKSKSDIEQKNFFENNTLMNPKSSKKGNVIAVKKIERILKNSGFMILQIGSEDCSICDSTIITPLYPELNNSILYFSKDVDEKNELLAQTLHVANFPTTYIIDRNYNIIGIINGISEYRLRIKLLLDRKKRSAFLKRLDINIDAEQRKREKDSLMQLKYILLYDKPKVDGDVQKGNELFVLSYAFKALMAKLENNYVNMGRYALISRSKGSYFFNNYLLYSYYKRKNMEDSALFYRNQALKYKSRVNEYIYESLIKELSNN